MLNKWTIGVGAVIIALIVGFGFGKYMTPTKTVTIETRKEVDKELLLSVVKQIREEVRKEMQTIAQQMIASTKQEMKKRTEILKKPDGTTIITKTEEVNTDTKTDAKTNIVTDTTVTTTTVKEETKTEDKSRTLEESKLKMVDYSKPNWYIGTNLGYLWDDVQKKSFGYKSMIIGGTIERRVFGPVFMGVWADSRGAGGVGLHLEF